MSKKMKNQEENVPAVIEKLMSMPGVGGTMPEGYVDVVLGGDNG